jgi:hypothetical protein
LANIRCRLFLFYLAIVKFFGQLPENMEYLWIVLCTGGKRGKGGMRLAALFYSPQRRSEHREARLTAQNYLIIGCAV